MVIGSLVWLIIGAAVVVWLIATSIPACSRRLPSALSVINFFLHSWLGRLLLLGAWAEVGWHLFCQRP
ncbi:MAG: hypothetical protein M1456_02295 [Actinobacteria bacterium]|nr:hypothetical protein [Actinomycetota bacterium]